MEKPTMPLPPLQPQPKPAGYCFVYLATLLGLILAAALTFFIMGTFYPFMIGFTVLALIALQYFVWGWWFERIYRSNALDAQSHDGDRQA